MVMLGMGITENLAGGFSKGAFPHCPHTQPASCSASALGSWEQAIRWGPLAPPHVT